jgi:deazaflavin-dependent oxidoreductase (nitroreductase family)
MAEQNDFNTKVIEEFRANDGKVGGPFEGATMLLLHHRGAKTGTERVTPLVYQPHGSDFVIFASKGGAPTDPHWFLNLQAHPQTVVEVGTEKVDVTASEVEGDERDAIYARQKEIMPGFADYEEKVKGIRAIPVVLLSRR